MQTEKQRIKRQNKSKSMRKQAVQVKVKKPKLTRTNLAKSAYVQGQMWMFNKVTTWLQLQLPKTGKKLAGKFAKFLESQK